MANKMDPMAMFDMERRTGISSSEVEEFAQRMDMISDAMKQIQDGTFDPLACKIPGYKTVEQEEKEREERERVAKERQRREDERRQKEKEEERTAWWYKAELRFSMEMAAETADEDDTNENGDQMLTSDKAEAWANRILAAYKTRDANDYSVWQNWVPEDPVTLEERAAREAAVERLRNAEFEQNNPEFCQQFRDDLAQRQASQRERERDAEKRKQRGNRYYKRREYDAAIVEYMAALALAPFNVAVLTNLAQCYLRLDALDDSVEFSTRALRVDPHHLKALSRRAAARHRQHQWTEAVADMQKALALAPENEDVVEQHAIIVGEYEDVRTQRELQTRLSSSLGRGSGDQSTEATRTATAELRLVAELIEKMEQQQQQEEEMTDMAVVDRSVVGQRARGAWVAYELMLPLLARNGDVRALFRTSGALHRLSQRVSSLLTAIVMDTTETTTTATAIPNAHELRRDEELVILVSMTLCLASAMIESPRNQILLFRDVVIRRQLMRILQAVPENDATPQQMTATWQDLRAALLRVWEELIDMKCWRRALIASPRDVESLVGGLQNQPHESFGPLLSVSSVLVTISEDAHGRDVLAAMRDTCLEGIVCVLQQCIAQLTRGQARDAERVASNLLGLLTNLSTHESLCAGLSTSRTSQDTIHLPSQSTTLSQSLVITLLELAPRFTQLSDGELLRDCGERALAALLNVSHAMDSQFRAILLREGDRVVSIVVSILTYTGSASTWSSQLVRISAHAVGLLCRMHDASFPSLATEAKAETSNTTSITNTVQEEERAPPRGLQSCALLDALYRLCQRSLVPAPDGHEPQSLASATDSDALWQLQAQIWCHVGWWMSRDAPKATQPEGNTTTDVLRTDCDVATYLLTRNAVPALVAVMERLNTVMRSSHAGPQAIRHVEPFSSPTERTMGNVAKVLSSLLLMGAAASSTDDASVKLWAYWDAVHPLRVVVTALQQLGDGAPARQNVAILLARLCQANARIKERVRDLRGLEILLSVSRSMPAATGAPSKSNRKNAKATLVDADSSASRHAVAF